MTKRLTRTIPPESGPMPQGLNINYNGVKQKKFRKKKNKEVLNQFLSNEVPKNSKFPG